MATWIQKVRHYSARTGISISRIGKKAGWPPTALSTRMVAKNMPGADKAFALAKSMGVSMEWLFDDSKDVCDNPPPFGIGNDLPPEFYESWRLFLIEKAARKDLLRETVVPAEILQADAQLKATTRPRRRK